MSINTGEESFWNHFSDAHPRHPRPKDPLDSRERQKLYEEAAKKLNKPLEFYDPKPLADHLFGDGFMGPRSEEQNPVGKLEDILNGI